MTTNKKLKEDIKKLSLGCGYKPKSKGLLCNINAGTLEIAKCGNKQKDGSIIICEECFTKIKLLEAELKGSQDRENEISEIIDKRINGVSTYFRGIDELNYLKKQISG